MKCNHLEGYSGEIIFGKIVAIGTEECEVDFKERCQACGKVMDKGTYIYRRKD
jgi:hypothetical protein